MTDCVLVTGASTGIGEAVAGRLARGGRRVFAGVRSDTDGDRLVSAFGAQLVPVQLDVTDGDQVAAAATAVGDALGPRDRLTGVVNNAGVAIGGPLEYLPDEQWRHQFDVNVFGQIAVTRTFLELIRHGHGRIVFIGSISGRYGMPLMGPYTGSKFAIEGIADALRLELRPAGIAVSVIEPGAVATPIWAKGRALADELTELLPAEGLARYQTFVDKIRAGMDFQEHNGVAPDVVAGVVERALSTPKPRARYVVGRDAKAAALMVRFTPDSLRDRIVSTVTDRLT